MYKVNPVNYLSNWNTLGGYSGIFSSLRHSTLNSNIPGGGRNALWYILFYYFLVINPNLMKIDSFSYNLSGTDILDFFKIGTGFCSVSTFSQQDVLFCVYFLLE